ncbi:uncharacterized protein LOC143169957 isoform X2 [Aptenodytes patagonicus]|uniref:uncharacterized protein LOC143169957 isoform X2 n=1 Tax=Aptenodytes patagonicus TaxID=9234 RepID=UPI003F9F083B
MAVRWPPVRGRAEDVVVHSSPGDAVDCTRLRLAWVVFAWPRSPCSVGVKRDRQSTYWLRTGAAEAGEARERWREQPSDWSYRRGREESRRKKRLNWQILLAAPRVEDSQATSEKRKGAEQEEEVSELANSPGTAESESCTPLSNRLPLFFSRVLHPAPHFWWPLPSIPLLQELTSRLSIPCQTNEHGPRSDC